MPFLDFARRPFLDFAAPGAGSGLLSSPRAGHPLAGYLQQLGTGPALQGLGNPAMTPQQNLAAVTWQRRAADPTTEEYIATHGSGEGAARRHIADLMGMQTPDERQVEAEDVARGALDVFLGTGVAGRAIDVAAGSARNKLGEFFNPRVPSSQIPQSVYHGTPHKFEQFEYSPRTLSTGEGAQAYGSGLYFAENPGIARSYREVLSGEPNISIGGTELPQNDAAIAVWKKAQEMNPSAANWDPDAYMFPANEVLDLRKAGLTTDDIRKQWADDPELLAAADAVDALGDVTTTPSGHFYEVDIPDEQIDKMLDWDAPLSEQPWIPKGTKEEIIARVKAEGRKPTLLEKAAVDLQVPGSAAQTDTGRTFYHRVAQQQANKLQELGDDVRRINREIREITGMMRPPNIESARISWPQHADRLESLYKELADVNAKAAQGRPDIMASNALRETGVPGAKFLSADEVTRNYTIWDDSILTTLKRDEKPIGLLAGGS